jgi:SAM-dependent methyltransferase
VKGFSADWLALREPADAKARAPELTKRLSAYCAGKEKIRILDLGSGTGSNLRFLAPHLKPAQSWTLVDHDEGLLDLAAEAGKSLSGVEVACRKLDLAKDLDRLDLSEVDLVTASALMDLVSAEWFDRLAATCRPAGCAVFFVLTYDGVMELKPSDRMDPLVRELFNRHQGEDKGFGPALGPEAPKHMARALIAKGLRVETAPSDWIIAAGERELHLALLEGFLAAAEEIGPARGEELRDWAARRRGLAARPDARLRVGHEDLFAFPSES